MFNAFNDFFGYYAYVGLLIFVGSFLVSLLLSWILVKITKKKWMFSVTMFLVGLIFFIILKMPATAFLYIVISVLGIVILLIKNFVKEK